MTPRAALIGAALGALMMVAGLLWLWGPWVLVVCGAALTGFSCWASLRSPEPPADTDVTS